MRPKFLLRRPFPRQPLRFGYLLGRHFFGREEVTIVNRPSRSSASECEAARLSQRLYRRAMSWLKRILSGHGRVQRVCKPNCKPTAQHGMIPGITSQHVRVRKAKLEHTLRHGAARASMRILELESRCTVIRTVGSNPTLSAISLKCRNTRETGIANVLQTFRNGTRTGLVESPFLTP